MYQILRKHEHNNIESNYEDLYNIIKDKNDTLYKPLPICETGIPLLKLSMLLLWK